MRRETRERRFRRVDFYTSRATSRPCLIPSGIGTRERLNLRPERIAEVYPRLVIPPDVPANSKEACQLSAREKARVERNHGGIVNLVTQADFVPRPILSRLFGSFVTSSTSVSLFFSFYLQCRGTKLSSQIRIARASAARYAADVRVCFSARIRANILRRVGAAREASVGAAALKCTSRTRSNIFTL